ncbi:MAG: hypothetical protein R3319_03655, partial [Candidatus Bathyarchaeia archaeon]|nr:hypothetical protein [Candidatus Bathyarchaeia archaeon]
SDIDLESAKSEGTIRLHDYLEYAEKGPETLKSADAESARFEFPLEEDVAILLQRLGYTIIPQVGCSSCPIDMGVVDPNDSGNYLLGIEFDGVTYQQSNSARDRDRLREQVLKQLGWRIHHVWSPAWVARRDSEIRRLSNALEQAHKYQLEKLSRARQSIRQAMTVICPRKLMSKRFNLRASKESVCPTKCMH